MLGVDRINNEVVKGMAGLKERTEISPRGKDNVLARELNLPLDGAQAAAVIAHGHSRRIHFGVAIDEANNTQRYFLLMAGIGFDAAVVPRVHPSLKKHFSKGTYVFSALSHIAERKPRCFFL